VRQRILLSRAILALLILSSIPATQAQQPSDEFRFVRPVHTVQNKRAGRNQPNNDVRTFNPDAVQPSGDPPEVAIGERLFMDTRFSQFFAVNFDGNVNHPLKQGDPILDTVTVKGESAKGPFKTRSINCRSCHFVAEFSYLGNDTKRTYADYESRSPVPQRDDGRRTTPRNSLSMVDSFIARDGSTLLHSDGEFASVASLVKSTMTERNFGWRPNERDKAIAHIAKVIREDDGTDPISYRYGGSYTRILAGKDPSIRVDLQLPKEYTLDVPNASDQQIFEAVVKLLSAYLESLQFARDQYGVHDGSPYDLFLRLNGLPRKPKEGESDAQYTARLRKEVEELTEPKFVDEDKQMTWFFYHDQKFNFGPKELQGLKIFLRTQDSAQSKNSAQKKINPAAVLLLPGTLVLVGFATRRSRHRETGLLFTIVAICSVAIFGGFSSGHPVATKKATQKSVSAGSFTPNVANCTVCHTPPDFTDRKFHNNGASQEEYDSVHGAGSFARLKIPSLTEREKNYDKYLPQTSRHPNATEIFRSPVSETNPQAADLGMWNIFANPDFPDPQPHLRKLMCGSQNCDDKQVLARTIALFRTPPIRDLEDSSPFMHTGRFNTIQDVLRYYLRISELSREGLIRNGAPELSGITLTEEDIEPLAAFLRSLNEDYD
jgi:hypothetical protein